MLHCTETLDARRIGQLSLHIPLLAFCQRTSWPGMDLTVRYPVIILALSLTLDRSFKDRMLCLVRALRYYL